MGEAIAGFAASKRRAGLKPGSILTDEHRLAAILGPVELERLAAVTPARARALYEARCDAVAVDTHRAELAAAKRLGRWAVERGALKASPFAGVKPVGRRRRGKVQLRIGEARELAAVCIERWRDHQDVGAPATLCALLLGMRASSISRIVARDLDDEGRVLWIDDDKTVAGRRSLAVPSVLREQLVALATGAAADQPLIGHSRYWVRAQVVRIRKLAGLPAVSPHGLRGTHATLGTLHTQQSPEAVAGALGHSSPAVTRAHYLEPGQVAEAEQRRVELAVLPGGRR